MAQHVTIQKYGGISREPAHVIEDAGQVKVRSAGVEITLIGAGDEAIIHVSAMGTDRLYTEVSNINPLQAAFRFRRDPRPDVLDFEG